MEFVMQIVIGLILIVLGFSNRKGNISSLHSYHIKRIKEEDVLPFGKLVGLGTIVVGCTIIVAGIFDVVVNKSMPMITNGILIVGLVPGISVITYAIMKYNKGLF